jgi:type IV pilus assembly protein PilA
MFILRRMLIALTLAVVCQLVPAFVYSLAKQTAGASSDVQRRAKAYEESCVGSLRTLNTAQVTYWGGDAKKGFARSLKQLGPRPRGQDLIDPVLATGKKGGYQFVLTPGPVDANGAIGHYTISARPSKVLVKGQRSFFTDEGGVIRSTPENRAATASDSAIQ